MEKRKIKVFVDTLASEKIEKAETNLEQLNLFVNDEFDTPLREEYFIVNDVKFKMTFLRDTRYDVYCLVE